MQSIWNHGSATSGVNFSNITTLGYIQKKTMLTSIYIDVEMLFSSFDQINLLVLWCHLFFFENFIPEMYVPKKLCYITGGFQLQNNFIVLFVYSVG